MVTRYRIEMILASAAVALSLLPSWRHPEVFLTVSDVLFCVTLLTILLTRGIPPAPFGMLTPYWNVALIIFLAALIGSTLLNGAPTRALVVCLQYFFSFYLLPLTILGRDRESTIRLIQVFVAAVFVTNLLGIILYYAGYTGDFSFVTGNGRLAGFIGNPNENAQVIAVACPIAAYLWLSGRMPVYFAVPLLLVLAIALVLTSSNNGLGMTALCMLVFFLLLRNLRILGRALAGLVICIGLVSVWGSHWLPEIFEQRVLGALRSGSLEEAGTFDSRLALMQEALEMVDDTMLVGIGVDQYRQISRYGAPVHNTYLLIWAEGGLPALIAWVGLMTMILLAALSVARRQPLVAATAFAVALAFVLVGFTAGHVYARYSVVPLLLVMALVLGSASEPAPLFPRPGGAAHPVPPGPPVRGPGTGPQVTPPAA